MTTTKTFEITVSHSGDVIATFYRDSELDARVLVNNMRATGYEAACLVLDSNGYLVGSF